MSKLNSILIEGMITDSYLNEQSKGPDGRIRTFVLFELSFIQDEKVSYIKVAHNTTIPAKWAAPGTTVRVVGRLIMANKEAMIRAEHVEYKPAKGDSDD